MELVKEIFTNTAVLWALAIVLAGVIARLLKLKIDENRIYPLLIFIANLIFKAELEYDRDGMGAFKKAQVIQELDKALREEEKDSLLKRFKTYGGAIEYVFNKVKPKLHSGFKLTLGKMLNLKKK